MTSINLQLNSPLNLVMMLNNQMNKKNKTYKKKKKKKNKSNKNQKRKNYWTCKNRKN